MRRYRIVVGIDLSEYSDIVLENALDQAARHDAPGEELKQTLWEQVYPALETFNQLPRSAAT